MPSAAVTTVVIVVGPILSEIAPDGEPDVTGSPFIVTVAFGSVVVGVTVTEVTELATDVV